MIKIILVRKRLHLSIQRKAVRGEERGLYSAARRLFGSWTRAREEAGCGRPKSFTKDEVLTALVSACDGGRIPHIRDSDVRPYVPAACRIFGKWREAVRMAKEQWSERMLRAPP